MQQEQVLKKGTFHNSGFSRSLNMKKSCEYKVLDPKNNLSNTHTKRDVGISGERHLSEVI